MITYFGYEIKLHEFNHYKMITHNSFYNVNSKNKIIYRAESEAGNIFALDPEEAIKLAKQQIDDYK